MYIPVTKMKIYECLCINIYLKTITFYNHTGIWNCSDRFFLFILFQFEIVLQSRISEYMCVLMIIITVLHILIQMKVGQKQHSASQ
jgi:hypothetical protein